MSEEMPFALIVGLMLFLFALYHFTSGSKAEHQSVQERQQGKQYVKNLSTTATLLRNSLGVDKQKLDSNTPLSITISVDDVIAKNNNSQSGTDSSDPSLLSFINKEGVKQVIALLCEFAHVHFLVAATSDTHEELARAQLGAEVLCDTAPLPFPVLPHRVLFYSTQIGKTAMVRQILPDVHIDADSSLCEAMRPFVGSVIQVTGAGGREGGAVSPPAPPPGSSSRPSSSRRVIDSLQKLLSPA